MPRKTRHVKKTSMWLPPLSLEMLLGLLVGLIPGLVEMNWEIHGLLVLFAMGLTLHIATRLEVRLAGKIIFAAIILGILVFGSYRSIWSSFHEEFPAVTGEGALSRIIEFFSLVVCCIAAYIFLIRPRGKKGYRVLPAQLIAFGFCVIAAGLIPVAIGLAWQFQQNWAAGIKPSGAPIFTVGPPQITQTPPLPALPAPQQPTTQNPLFVNYNLTEDGVTVLTKELFKIRDALRMRIELDRMATDGTAGGFVGNFGRVCDQAGIECPVNNVHPNTPDERGIMIYVADFNKPPEAAQELRSALLKIGLDVPFVTRPGFGPDAFSLFIGPRP